MDPSALIFVALVVAWAVYLVPKALEHHDESLRQRTMSGVSRTMRVLARREKRGPEEPAELVTTAERRRRGHQGDTTSAEPAPAPEANPAYVEVPAPLTATQWMAHRAATRRATKRRRRVLGLILVALLAVTGVAAYGLIEWYWLAAPGGVLLAWLIACRLMVRKERTHPRVRVPAPRAAEAPAAPEPDVAAEPVRVTRSVTVYDEDGNATGEITVITEETAAGRWDPVEVPLPTYVNKPAAARSVRTIDLDGTGVWSSGRNDADSAIAREAEEAARQAKAAEDAARQAEQHRATGS